MSFVNPWIGGIMPLNRNYGGYAPPGGTIQQKVNPTTIVSPTNTWPTTPTQQNAATQNPNNPIPDFRRFLYFGFAYIAVLSLAAVAPKFSVLLMVVIAVGVLLNKWVKISPLLNIPA